MASSADKEVRVPIGLPVETNAPQAASALAGLRDQITASKDAFRQAAAEMKNFKGNSEELKAARDQLRATMDREQATIQKASLELLKQGTTYTKVADDAKKFAKAQEEAKKKLEAETLKKLEARTSAFGAAADKAGGPVARLRAGLASLKSIASDGGGMGIATLAAAGLTAALVALVAATVAVYAGLGRAILRGADFARSLNLTREAALGSASQAKDLGVWVDQLAAKVPASTQSLNDLAVSMRKNRLGGQVLIDTLNAVAQANDGLGDAAGAKLRQIIERGRLAGRVFANPFELQGTGIEFDDIAGSVASKMKVGLAEARQALFEGRVSLSDGAAAIRDAMEKKLGGINLRKMLSFDNLSETIGKQFRALTSDVDLEPALKSLKEFFSILDTSTAEGNALKKLATVIGTGIVKALERGLPIAHKFFRGLLIGGLNIYIAFLKVRKAFREAFGDSEVFKNIKATELALNAGKLAIYGITAGLIVFGTVVGGTLAAVAAFGYGLYKVFVEPFVKAYEGINSIEWSKLGASIVDGLMLGLTGKTDALLGKVADLASGIRKVFAGKLEIHSPSRAAFRDMMNYGKGAEIGLQKSTPAVERAAEDMASSVSAASPSPPRGGLAGRMGSVSLTVNVEIKGGDAKEIAAQLDDEALWQKFRKRLLLEMAGAGVAVPT